MHTPYAVILQVIGLVQGMLETLSPDRNIPIGFSDLPDLLIPHKGTQLSPVNHPLTGNPDDVELLPLDLVLYNMYCNVP